MHDRVCNFAVKLHDALCKFYVISIRIRHFKKKSVFLKGLILRKSVFFECYFLRKSVFLKCYFLRKSVFCMLKRKIYNKIESYLKEPSNKMLLIDGARQIGKSYIIRSVGQSLFPNYIEINMEEDKQGERLFAEAKTIKDFYLALSSIAGDRMGDKVSTLVFIDEIQAYDHLLTLVKFLMQDDKFTYIASGSQLGITLRKTQSIPGGYYERVRMFPLDFEEFLWANGVGELVIESMRESFNDGKSLNEGLHNRIMDLLRKYLLVGGLPDAVNCFVAEQNIIKIRQIHSDIHDLYLNDAAKYEMESGRKLKIQRIYNMVPSLMESRKKRIVAKDIEEKEGKRMADYEDEFEYLVASGITIECKAISLPSYSLCQNEGKNLLKLYMNDVGMLTAKLFRNNIKAVMDDECSVNLGAVYETFVADELKAHGNDCFYYDNKKYGEVDFLVDDVKNLSTMPLEVKSGKDYKIHSALDHFLEVKNYDIHKAYVLSNERQIFTESDITYIPIYFVMFFASNEEPIGEW